ncbi:MAG: FapA family protein [Proteobacteria bacterium]|nr:FapA family protein [Pseudomonadota bacterium]
MTIDNKIVETICPSCNFPCHVSISSIGKKTTCEKCSHSFRTVKFNHASLLNQFCKIAIKNFLVSEQKLNEIYSEQIAAKSSGQALSIEDRFIEKGFISVEQKDRLMLASVRKLNRMFVGLAMEMNFITKAEGEAALEQQAEDFKNDKLTLVGDILVKKGLLDKDQRESLLLDIQQGKSQKEKQKLEVVNDKTDKYPFIGVVAVEKDLITKSQLENAVVLQQEQGNDGTHKPFEDILYESGIISNDIRDKLVLKTLKKIDKEMGKIAIENGFVTKDDLIKAAARQASKFKNYNYIPLMDILAEDEKLAENEYDLVFSRLHGIERRRIEELIQKGQRILFRISQTRDTGPKYHSVKNDAEPPDTHDENIQDTETNKELSDDDEPGIVLKVSEDSQSAYIHLSSDIKGDTGKSISDLVMDIKNLVEENDIVFGVIGDDLIEACIQAALFKDRQFKIASGEAAKEGSQAEIKYYFETDYLKAGVVTDDGVMDFRDRGDIPFVKKGDILAKFTPSVKGQNGFDVYGNIVSVPEIEAVKFQCGSGTVLSEDGLTIFAGIDGRPEILIGGQIAVYSEMTIKGDVNFETGNIDFKGNVDIQGTICEGFKVRSVNVTAKNINGGEVDVTGNVDVSGGIVNAKIKADGYVQAMYIIGTTVEAFGDFLIVKEIIDSDVRLSGMCRSERCKVISSSLSAKMGVEVSQIGTDVSTPCKIRVGLNDHIDTIIQFQKAILRELKGNLEQKQSNVEKYLDELRSEHQKIMEETMYQDSLNAEKKRLKGKIEKNKVSGNLKKIKIAEKDIEEIDRKLTKSRRQIKAYFSTQDRLLDSIFAGRKVIESHIRRIEPIGEYIRMVSKKQNDKAGVSQVKVKNQLFAKTMIFGQHSSIIIQEDVKNVTVGEFKLTDPEGGRSGRWVMEIKKLK